MSATAILIIIATSAHGIAIEHVPMRNMDYCVVARSSVMGMSEITDPERLAETYELALEMGVVLNLAHADITATCEYN